MDKCPKVNISSHLCYRAPPNIISWIIWFFCNIIFHVGTPIQTHQFEMQQNIHQNNWKYINVLFHLLIKSTWIFENSIHLARHKAYNNEKVVTNLFSSDIYTDYYDTAYRCCAPRGCNIHIEPWQMISKHKKKWQETLGCKWSSTRYGVYLKGIILSSF